MLVKKCGLIWVVVCQLLQYAAGQIVGTNMVTTDGSWGGPNANSQYLKRGTDIIVYFDVASTSIMRIPQSNPLATPIVVYDVENPCQHIMIDPSDSDKVWCVIMASDLLVQISIDSQTLTKMIDLATTTGGSGQLSGLAITSDGETGYACEATNGKVYEIDIGSQTSSVFKTGIISMALVIDSYDSTLYLVKNSGQIVKLDIATKMETIIAGTEESSYIEGVGGDLTLNTESIALSDDEQVLFVQDRSAHTVRAVEISTGHVLTVAGKQAESGNVDGTGDVTRFSSPRWVTNFGNKIVAVTDNSGVKFMNYTNLAFPTESPTTSPTRKPFPEEKPTNTETILAVCLACAIFVAIIIIVVTRPRPVNKSRIESSRFRSSKIEPVSR